MMFFFFLHDVTFCYLLCHYNISIYILLFYIIQKVFNHSILWHAVCYKQCIAFYQLISLHLTHTTYLVWNRFHVLGISICFTASKVSGCLQWTLRRAQVFGVNFEVTEHGQIFGALAGAFMSFVGTCLSNILSDLDQADRTPENTTDWGRFFLNVPKRQKHR